MLTKSELLEAISKIVPDFTESNLANFDAIVRVSQTLIDTMPSIGILSIRYRMSSFIETCRRLDAIVESGQISGDDGACVFMMLRLSDRRFKKAMQCFTLQAPNIGLEMWAALPKSAQQAGRRFSSWGR